jgi:hypothetical protein
MTQQPVDPFADPPVTPAEPDAAATDVVSTQDVASLTGGLTTDAVANVPRVVVPKPFLSEGMRSDLESGGRAIDPVSGAVYKLDRESGVVTVTDKDGKELDTFELATHAARPLRTSEE